MDYWLPLEGRERRDLADEVLVRVQVGEDY